MNPLFLLREAGQSVWLDFLRRGLLTSGNLEHRVHHDAVTGVTSNPTIFGRAIAGRPTTTRPSPVSPPEGRVTPARCSTRSPSTTSAWRPTSSGLCTPTRPASTATCPSSSIKPALAHDAARVDRRRTPAGREDRQAQRHDQGAGHERGDRRDRGTDRRRRQRQHHPAVLRRRVRTGGARLPVRSRRAALTAGEPLGTRSRPWRRSSSPASTRRSIRCCPRDRPCRAEPPSPTPSSPTSASARCSRATAGSGSPGRVPGSSGRCGRRRGPRTPRTRTCTTSRRSSSGATR